MGYYINQDDKGNALSFDKAEALIRAGIATLIGEPASLDSVPADRAVVCVVNNGSFTAAAFVFSERELQEFKIRDSRHRQWLAMNKELVHRLTGYRP